MRAHFAAVFTVGLLTVVSTAFKLPDLDALKETVKEMRDHMKDNMKIIDEGIGNSTSKLKQQWQRVEVDIKGNIDNTISILSSAIKNVSDLIQHEVEKDLQDIEKQLNGGEHEEVSSAASQTANTEASQATTVNSVDTNITDPGSTHAVSIETTTADIQRSASVLPGTSATVGNTNVELTSASFEEPTTHTPLEKEISSTLHSETSNSEFPVEVATSKAQVTAQNAADNVEVQSSSANVKEDKSTPHVEVPLVKWKQN